ncbi:MAG: hypothetical protein J7J71_01375, partial [Deltaproteobacteria bacterium]|nr:hypothetical protein [Candidatus Tharpella sp.]
MEKTEIRKTYKVKSWNRFVARRLAVKSELMGCKHKFQFEDGLVEISLPDLTQVKDRYDDSAMAAVGSRWAENNEPIEYEIFQVDVGSNIDCELSLHPETLNRNACAFELYSEEERAQFERYCVSHQGYAKRASEYWFSILRWCLDDYRIGRFERVGNDSGWSTYLKEIETGKDVWIGSSCFTVQGYRVIKCDEWNDIQNCLKSALNIPVYLSLKHDAELSMSHNDYVRSIVELAMACEVFMRFMVLDKLPKELGGSLTEAIEELNINQYVTKHFRSLVPSANLKEYGKLSSELSSLFSKRNKIVHMGKNTGSNAENCERFLELANKLFK